MLTDFGQEEFELIGAIYEAAMDPALWQGVLDRIRHIAQADRCNLTFFDQLNRKRNNTVLSGHYPPNAVHQYLTTHIDDDVKMVRAAHDGMNDGEFFFPSQSQHRYDVSDAVVGNSYKEFFRSEELNDGPIFGTALFKGNFSLGMMGISRNKGRAPFKPEALDFWNRFSVHLSRAVRIHHQLISARDGHYRLQQALEKTATGVALLDESGRVIFANQEAGRVCHQHPALTIGPGGYLIAADNTENRQLSQLIKNTIDLCNSEHACYNKPVSLPVRHPKASHPLKVTALPLNPISGGELLSQGICCVIFINDPQRKWNVSSDYMRHAYELTPSECEVAGALLNGLRAADISSLRGTSEETVRWQIKHILQKTNMNSQLELLQLLMNLSSDFSAPVA